MLKNGHFDQIFENVRAVFSAGTPQNPLNQAAGEPLLVHVKSENWIGKFWGIKTTRKKTSYSPKKNPEHSQTRTLQLKLYLYVGGSTRRSVVSSSRR